MGHFPIVTILLIAANVLFSSKGIMSPAFFDSWVFRVEHIRLQKDYKRLVTSGFLHLNWLHLVLNMYSLYAFGYLLEASIGPWVFLAIYATSLIGGNLLSLFLHRHQDWYSAAGASGAVSGIIFSSLALFPGMDISLFGILPLPGWLYGLAFVLYSIYGIRSERRGIGHDAHLGGAMIGMLTALAFYPSALRTNYVTILVILLPCLVFLVLMLRRPEWLIIGTLRRRRDVNPDYLTQDDRYNLGKAQKQKEVDRILDKIAAKGMSSLSEKEKALLKEYSETQQ